MTTAATVPALLAIIENAIAQGQPISYTPDAREVLRDLLKAMREPSEAQVAAIRDNVLERPIYPESDWRRMVDALRLEV